MMHEVVEHRTTVYRELGVGRYGPAGHLESPGLLELSIRRLCDRRARRCHVLFEQLQYLLRTPECLELGRWFSRRHDVELVPGDRVYHPARQLRDERGEPAQGHRLGVRFPGRLAIGDSFEYPARGGHLFIELREEQL